MDKTGRDSDPAGVGGVTTWIRTDNDWTTTPPSIAIIEAIAAIEDVDPVALSMDGATMLAEHVDPEALNRLVTDNRETEIALTVTIDEYTARIEGRELIVTHAENDLGSSE